MSPAKSLDLRRLRLACADRSTKAGDDVPGKAVEYNAVQAHQSTLNEGRGRCPRQSPWICGDCAWLVLTYPCEHEPPTVVFAVEPVSQR